MDINSIQGINAYTANTLMSDTGSVQNNNKEVTGVEPIKENTQTLQEAFQVEITQQALTLQAQNTDDLAKEDQVQMTEQTQQALEAPSLPGQRVSQLDIVA